jgi:hypothetical protein
MRKFTDELKKIDPLGLCAPVDDEYEVEALSILSRFVELNVTQQLTDEIALLVVKHTFEFWFGWVSSSVDCNEIAISLLKIFRNPS